MNESSKKKKGPVRYLLQIVINFLISAALFSLGPWIDSRIFSAPPEGGGGHGMPIFTLLFMLIAGIFFVISTIVNLVKAVKAAKKQGSRGE